MAFVPLIIDSNNDCVYIKLMDFPGGSVVNNPPANAGDAGNTGLIPELGRLLE